MTANGQTRIRRQMSPRLMPRNGLIAHQALRWYVTIIDDQLLSREINLGRRNTTSCKINIGFFLCPCWIKGSLSSPSKSNAPKESGMRDEDQKGSLLTPVGRVGECLHYFGPGYDDVVGLASSHTTTFYSAVFYNRAYHHPDHPRQRRTTRVPRMSP